MNWFQIIITILTPITSGIFAVLASSGFWNYKAKKDTKKTAERKIIEGIAHDAIIEACKKYIERGYIYNDELDDLKKFYYDPYRELGGNGTAEKAYKEISDLPLKIR